MKRFFFAFSLTLLLVLALTASAAAQSAYLFHLDKEVVNVYWNADGTEALDYVFSFTNDPNGAVIDYVDVGMPNSNFDTSTVSADVNGQAVNVSTSDYQGSGSGFAVDMGNYAIQPGQSGSVHVSVGSISQVLYTDSSDSTYASADFSPTYFGSQYVEGSTDLTVIFHLPLGVQPAEARYHNPSGGWPGSQAPQTDTDNQNRITYTWENSAASASAQYTFGASFPKQYVPAGAIVVPAAFNIDLSGLTSNLQPLCCVGFILIFFVGLPIVGAVNNNRRKLAYLPPKIAIEGHGIKRGLTAVEAGILMEEPLDKVMTMILFGVVKKNAATVVSKDPLKLQIASPLPADLHDYETDFLQAFATEDPATRRKDLQEMVVKMVNGLSEKMKGFSRKETIDYYKSIMERAWQQIEAAGTPEVKSQLYDESLEWTMLDKNYDQRTRNVFTGPIPIFLPIWWGSYDPTFRPAAAAPAGRAISAPGGRSGSPVSLPGAAVAASMVNSVQGFSSHVLGNVNTFTSAVTGRTNPVPVSTSRAGSSGAGRWSGGGGHSCACACACAGCACACAGGGR
ncbi:MAG: hypothetical protein ABSB41_17430 [Anaerolineales bacterium]|jgi:hypothetical protein